MDLRKEGEPFEKKYVQFTDQNRVDITKTFHAWQGIRAAQEYEDVPEYCHSAGIEEIRAKDYSLVPSKYIEFINRDENVDFGSKMTELQSELSTLLKEEAKSKSELLDVFKELGYEIEL